MQNADCEREALLDIGANGGSLLDILHANAEGEL